MPNPLHGDTIRKRDFTIGRREFTVASALAVLSGVTITVGACGGGTASPSSPSPMPSSSDKVGIVSANHGHTATITSAQLMAGGDLSLDITGTSDHPHTVQLTGADLTQINDGQRVSKVSSNDDAHTHSVTFN